MSNRKSRRNNAKYYNRGVNAQPTIEVPVWMSAGTKHYNACMGENTELKIARNYTGGKVRRIAISFYGKAMDACEGKEFVLVSRLSESRERFYVKPCVEPMVGTYKLQTSSKLRRYAQVTLGEEDLAVLDEWVGEYRKLHYEPEVDAWYVNKSERIEEET